MIKLNKLFIEGYIQIFKVTFYYLFIFCQYFKMGDIKKILEFYQKNEKYKLYFDETLKERYYDYPKTKYIDVQDAIIRIHYWAKFWNHIDLRYFAFINTFLGHNLDMLIEYLKDKDQQQQEQISTDNNSMQNRSGVDQLRSFYQQRYLQDNQQFVNDLISTIMGKKIELKKQENYGLELDFMKGFNQQELLQKQQVFLRNKMQNEELCEMLEDIKNRIKQQLNLNLIIKKEIKLKPTLKKYYTTQINKIQKNLIIQSIKKIQHLSPQKQYYKLILQKCFIINQFILPIYQIKSLFTQKYVFLKKFQTHFLLNTNQNVQMCHFCKIIKYVKKMKKCTTQYSKHSKILPHQFQCPYKYSSQILAIQNSTSVFSPFYKFKQEKYKKICGRYFCQECLTLNKHYSNLKSSSKNKFICPYCLNICDCSRCLMNILLIKLKSQYLIEFGSLIEIDKKSMIRKIFESSVIQQGQNRMIKQLKQLDLSECNVYIDDETMQKYEEMRKKIKQSIKIQYV